MKMKKILTSVLALGLSFGAMISIPKASASETLVFNQEVVTRDTVKLVQKVAKQKKEIKKLKKEIKAQDKRPSLFIKCLKVILDVACLAALWSL